MDLIAAIFIARYSNSEITVLNFRLSKFIGIYVCYFYFNFIYLRITTSYQRPLSFAQIEEFLRSERRDRSSRTKPACLTWWRQTQVAFLRGQGVNFMASCTEFWLALFQVLNIDYISVLFFLCTCAKVRGCARVCVHVYFVRWGSRRFRQYFSNITGPIILTVLYFLVL